MLLSLPDQLAVHVYLTLVFTLLSLNPSPSSQPLPHFQSQSTALSSDLVFIGLIFKKDKLDEGLDLK